MRNASGIARWIMQADESDPRERIFGILRCFPDATGGEIKRGMEIALEFHEAEMWEAYVTDQGRGP